MRRILPILALLGAFSMLALAESYSGTLLDSACYDQQKKASACAATPSTTSFALDAQGMVYKLDRNGNTKAAEALKSRADRSKGNQPPSGQITAKVSGTEKGGTITVESIDVQ